MLRDNVTFFLDGLPLHADLRFLNALDLGQGQVLQVFGSATAIDERSAVVSTHNYSIVFIKVVYQSNAT